MVFNIILADSDENYIKHLGQYLRNCCHGNFNIDIFTQSDTLQKYLSDNSNETDILLMTPEFLSLLSEKHSEYTVLLLASKKTLCHSGAHKYIFKYQPASKISDIILEVYSRQLLDVDKMEKSGNDTVLVSIFSPQGGSGKSVMSITLCTALSHMGKKTLYLNMDQFAAYVFFIIFNSFLEVGMEYRKSLHCSHLLGHD